MNVFLLFLIFVGCVVLVVGIVMIAVYARDGFGNYKVRQNSETFSGEYARYTPIDGIQSDSNCKKMCDGSPACKAYSFFMYGEQPLCVLRNRVGRVHDVQGTTLNIKQTNV